MMGTTRSKTSQQIGDPVGTPNTEPDGFELDRLTSGLHASITKLSVDSAELKGSVGRNSTDIVELRTAIKELADKSISPLSDKITSLDRSIASQTGFLNGAKWVVGGGFIAIAAVLGFTWSSVIQPGIAKAIAEQIKPELTSHIKEVFDAQQTTPKPKQGK